MKDYRQHAIATLFGQVAVRLPRFRRAGCATTETGVESGRCHVTGSRFLRGRDVWPDCRDDISGVLVAALRDAGHWKDGKGLVLPQQGGG